MSSIHNSGYASLVVTLCSMQQSMQNWCMSSILIAMNHSCSPGADGRLDGILGKHLLYQFVFLFAEDWVLPVEEQLHGEVGSEHHKSD